MSQWPAAKTRRVLAALLRIGWRIRRTSGSHRTLECDGWDDDEIGPRMLARVAKRRSGQA